VTAPINFGDLTAQITNVVADVVAEQSDPLAPLRGRSIDSFRNTEGGNGDRVASRDGDRILCDFTGRSRVYFVADDAELWHEDVTGEVIRRVDSVVQEMYERGQAMRASADEEEADRGNSLENWARISDTLGAMERAAALAVDKYSRRIVAAEYFDARPDIISAGTQVIELQDDGVLVRPRTRDDRCTLVTSVPYRPEVLEKKPPQAIHDFIELFLPEENRARLMFRLLGYALRGGNDRRYFVILKGGTTTGKTQLVRAVSETLGGYVGAAAATVFRTNHEDKPRPDVIALYRKRIAFFAEASKSWRLEASRIKQFTGGDVDPQRGMRSNVIRQETPMCLPLVYTNEMPKIIGLDEATKRRTLVMSMDHTLPKEKEDPSYRERFIKSVEVREWLLAALVRGYTESRDPKLMTELEEAFTLSTSEAIAEMYHLADFLGWATDGDEPRLKRLSEDEMSGYGWKSRCVTLSDLHSVYVRWVKTHGDRYDKMEQLSLVDFNKQLKDNHGFREGKSGAKRWLGWVLNPLTLGALSQSAGDMMWL